MAKERIYEIAIHDQVENAKLLNGKRCVIVNDGVLTCTIKFIDERERPYGIETPVLKKYLRKIEMGGHRVTPDYITKLGDKEVFVFGSNIQGQHIGGAAKIASESFGAKWGEYNGITGDCYAIPTVDFMYKEFGIKDIKPYVDEFIDFARKVPSRTFLVTAIGCGIAGHSVRDMAELFRDAETLDNVFLPKEFWRYLNLR